MDGLACPGTNWLILLSAIASTYYQSQERYPAALSHHSSLIARVSDTRASPTTKLVVSQLGDSQRQKAEADTCIYRRGVNESHRMSTYCMTTPASIDNSDSILLFSTSSAHNQPSRAPLSRENRRIRSDRKTYPSPPPSPLRPRRTSWDSGLAAPPSLKVSLKRGCSYLSEDLELGGNKPHLSSAFGHDMIPDSQLENRKAFSGTHRQSAARNNGHEQVRNVGSNTANGNAATGASSGYSSTGEIVAKLGTQTTYTPKKKRYFEVDPFTGEERITEIMDGLASAKGESGKRVYALSSFGPFGRSHSTNGSHPVSGSASPLKMKTPSGVHEGIPLLPPTLRIRTDLDTPEPVVDRKENICESPEPMESTGLSLASMANGAGLHRANTLAGSPPSQVLLAASGVGRAPDSSTSMSCIVETPVTPTATSLSAPAVGGGRSDPGGLLALHPGPEPARINDSSPVKPVNSKPLSGQCPLKGVTKDAQMPANKNRREPPPPLSLADNAGNFATLASSRERRQQPANTAHTEPILNTPGKTLTTRSVPATPVRTHSRKNSHPSHTLHSSLPEMRPLSPISPPSDEYLPHVPPDASERIIQAHADLYAMGNCGVPPPFGLPRRRIKGAYRLPMETDTPDLEDFIVLKYSGATYWQGNVGAEGTQTQPGEEGGASSTGVERWSGGNVKGPKYKARPKQKHKPGPLLGSSTIPHNSTKAKLNKKLTLKAKNNTLNQPSTGKGKSAGTSTAVGNIDYGVKSRPARKLSSLIMDDDTLGDDPMDEDYGTNSGPRPANRGGIPPSVSGQLSNGRPQRIQTKYRLSAKGMSPIDLPVATASSPYPFISDTEISSDEDIISATSAFGHGTAPTQTSLVSQSREQRKHDRINTIRFTEGGPGGEGFRQGSSSIFSTVQLGIPGVGVMGPPAAKVSPAEYKLYIGRRGDQVPLFGSGGNMVVPGLGAGSLSEHTAVGSDPQYGGSSLFQPGGIVEVRRVEDPLLEATMEIKRLIYESGHQGGLAPAPGILGGLSIEKVYWSGVSLPASWLSSIHSIQY